MVRLIYEYAKQKDKCRFCSATTRVIVRREDIRPLVSPVYVCPKCRDTKWKQVELAKAFKAELTIDMGILSSNEVGMVPRDQQLRPQRGIDFRDLREKEVASLTDGTWGWDFKFDGVRLLGYFLPTGELRLLSSRISKRTGEYSDKTDNFEHLKMVVPELAGTVLDCEGILDIPEMASETNVAKGSRNITVSLMNAGSAKSNALQEEHGKLKLMVFDCLKFKGVDLRNRAYVSRRIALIKALGCISTSHIERTELNGPIRELAEIERAKERALAAGHEGIMLKRMSSLYRAKSVGQRNREMVKLKQEVTYDGFITGFKPGERGNAGLVGALLVSAYRRDGSEYEFAAVGNIARHEMEEMSVMVDGMPQLRRDYYGRVVEIRAQYWTKNQRLLHAQLMRWRSDKPKNECTLPF